MIETYIIYFESVIDTYVVDEIKFVILMNIHTIRFRLKEKAIFLEREREKNDWQWKQNVGHGLVGFSLIWNVLEYKIEFTTWEFN